MILDVIYSIPDLNSFLRLQTLTPFNRAGILVSIDMVFEGATFICEATSLTFLSLFWKSIHVSRVVVELVEQWLTDLKVKSIKK